MEKGRTGETGASLFPQRANVSGGDAEITGEEEVGWGGRKLQSKKKKGINHELGAFSKEKKHVWIVFLLWRGGGVMPKRENWAR